MASTPTKNPVPSENYDDLRFNSGKLDEFVTSPDDNYTDRLGIIHLTARGLQNSVAGALLPVNNLSDVQNADSSLSNLGGATTGIAVFKSGTPAAARSAIAAAASGSNSDITQITGLTTALALAQGGTGAKTAATARSNLLAAASGANSDITSITGLTTSLSINQGGTGSNTASGARTSLGLGTLSTQSSSSVNITGGTVSGIIDLAVADGGTGASTPATARSNLGAKADAGVTDASNATAGQVGEVITAISSATSITSASVTNIVSISLTAGDWDVISIARFDPSASSITGAVCGLNINSATQPSFPDAFQIGGLSSSSTVQINSPLKRLNLSVTTTVYLVGIVNFSSGTATSRGYIQARRIR